MRTDNSLAQQELSLDAARASILSQISPLPAEQVKVNDGLYRFTAQNLYALRPKPSYDQSTRDGFALAREPGRVEEDFAVFTLCGEVAAGCLQSYVLKPGQAVRIMTGGLVPEACARVIPFEVCRETGNTVSVPLAELERSLEYIRFCGSELRAGDELVPAGTRLLPDHLLALAENSGQTIAVHKQPSVAVLCTGSELVEPGQDVLAGQKVSGNGILLSGLIKSHGGECCMSEIITDRADAILSRVREFLAHGADLILTTGGMGPGRYDLMEQVFQELDGELIYNRLRVRPGRFTLFGMVGSTPFFALPGPPPAVRILFHELVAPALWRLQGREGTGGLVDGLLESSRRIRQSEHLHLQAGVARIAEGRLLVRAAGRREPVNAIIHLAAGNIKTGQGRTVPVRLTVPLDGLAG